MPRRRPTSDATERLSGDAVVADAQLAARTRSRTHGEFVGQLDRLNPWPGDR